MVVLTCGVADITPWFDQHYAWFGLQNARFGGYYARFGQHYAHIFGFQRAKKPFLNKC